MIELSPKTNPYLFGHEEAENKWRRDMESGKLTHGWIISGPRGIGKATLAYRIARLMLSSPWKGEVAERSDAGGGLDAPDSIAPPPNLPPQGGEEALLRRIATGAHPDLLVIEPELDDKKGEQKNIITAEQARAIPEFLSLTPAESQWRVVIVDSVDQLNPTGANSILKILEEPPAKTVLLLISHNPGSLLPTIRSRCAMLKLTPLSDTDFDKAIEATYPDMESATRQTLRILSGGSPGLVTEYEGQGAVELYSALLDVLATLPTLDTLKVHAFADQLAGGQIHAQFKLFSELVLCLFARVCKAAAGLPVEILSGEETIFAKLAALHSSSTWAAKWQQAENELSLAASRHLDLKQVVIVFFHSIAHAEPFSLGAAA